MTSAVITGAVVGWPLVAGAIAIGAEGSGPELLGAQPLTAVAWRTVLYSVVITAGAVLLGWIPGRVLARVASSRRAGAVAVALLMPICLPGYTIFYLWWQLWPADSALFAWAAEHGAVTEVRNVTLVIGLMAWSWPIVAWCTAAAHRTVPASRSELLGLDGARGAATLADAWRTDRAGLIVGAAIVFVLTFNNTTSFDLAQIFTFGNELRARRAIGATTADILIAAWPTIVIAALFAAVIWHVIARLSDLDVALRTPRTTRRALAVTALVWGATLVVPALVLVIAVSRVELGSFLPLYGGSIASSVAVAGGTSLAAGVIAMLLLLCWASGSRRLRRWAALQSIGWIMIGLIPGTAVGVMLEAAWNHHWTLPFLGGGGGQNGSGALAASGAAFEGTVARFMYQTPFILVVGHLARAGLVGAVLARWIAAREPAALRDLRAVDGAVGIRALVTASRPALVATGIAAAAVAFVLSLGEIPVTAAVHPPGSDPLAVRLLNAMHYQRPDVVMAAAALMMVLAALAASTILFAARRPIGGRTAAVLLALLPAVAVLPGCTPEDGRPLDTDVIFGETGLALGQFAYPRAVDVDGEREHIYVVDKTARVQRFSFEGTPELEWSMPARESGKPTGISVAPDGRVFVADTHYFRVIAFDPDGHEVLRFGEYGQGPGQFLFVTDIAFAPDGRLFVSEYGGNDRIQVFDAEGHYQYEFGAPGEGDGEFMRPQALRFSPDGRELYIADACNHRIIVTDLQGNVQRMFGAPGIAPGQMHYPYGFDFLDDGTLVVSEFGNNRLQHFRTDGTPLGIVGRFGANEGEVKYPWSVAIAGDRMIVLDSGNNRVQIADTP